ncbi:hypothetical protein CLAFUR4_07987 [Fulvia fulva]|nr:hypothetical protein CLAFUR4_07987 [Fulvia fulva]WPV26965.1 hypothetical protein CLAFUW7_07983 [Fulvia fulva]
MKTCTLFSAIALASAVAALPQQAPRPPSYAQTDEDTNGNIENSPQRQQRPQPYQKQHNGAPNFSGDPKQNENEVDAVSGNRGSNNRPRPQSYGSTNNVNVDSNGRPSQQDEEDEISPQQNRRPQDSTNNMRPQKGNNRQRLGPANNGIMPEEDDQESEDEDQPEDEEDPQQPEDEEDQDEEDDEEQPEDENENHFSPQQNSNNRQRPGQSTSNNGIRPGGIGAHSGNYPQSRPGPIGGIGPGGIGSPQSNNNFGPASNPSQIGGQCVSRQEVNQFVRRFIGVLNRQGSDIGDAQATAEQIIAEDYIGISSSINTLEGEGDNGDTDSIAAESKQEWIDGMFNAPPFRGIQTLKVLVFCDQVVWYWNFASVGSGQFPVKGFNLFTLRRGGAQGSFQSQSQFSAGGSGSGSIGAGSSQLQGGASVQGSGSGSSSSHIRPSGLSGPGPASGVPTGNTIQAIKLETEFDSLANALDTGFQCTDRDGNDFQTSGGQGGPMGGMANFQNNRPQDQDQSQDEDDEDQLQPEDEDSEDSDLFQQKDVGTDRFGDIPPQSSRQGTNNVQFLQGGGGARLSTSQRQGSGSGSGNGRNFNAGTDSNDFDQALGAGINNQFDTASRGQFGPGGGGRLNANLNANSLAGEANGGTLDEARVQAQGRVGGGGGGSTGGGDF